jgi:8-oxo-dGTP diphosphatase
MGTPASAGATAEERPDRQRTYVGAYALCVRDGRILLARMVQDSPDAGQWTLPGGGID